MTSASKNVYINKLDGIVNKYNNTRHSTIKMNSIDVKSNTYIDSSKEIYDKDIQSKIDDKYKNIFAKGCIPNCSEEVFEIKNVKNAVPLLMI